MNVFDLVAKITMDTGDYEKSLSNAGEKTSSFASSIGNGIKKSAKIGAAAVGAVTAAVALTGKNIYSGVSDIAEYGDAVEKTSQKVGMSAEAYQEWDYVMKISGTEMSNMTMGLKTLTNKFDDAVNGGESSIKMFEKLGLSMEDLEGMSREDLFSTVITQFQQMEDSTERAALANDLLGRSGQELVPLFNTTAEETRKLKEEAREYGTVMSNEAVEASATFQDRLTRLGGAMRGVKQDIYGQFLPGITSVVEGLADVVAGNEDANDALSEGLSKTIDTMVNNLPRLLDVAGRVIKGLADGIMKNIPKLAKSGVEMIVKFGKYVIKAIPKLAEAAVQIVQEIATGLTEALPELATSAAEAIAALVKGFSDNASALVRGATQVFGGLAKALIEAVPIIVKSIPQVISSIGKALTENFGAVLPLIGLAAGKSLLGGLKSSVAYGNFVGELLHGPTGLVTKLAAGLTVVGVMVANSFDEAYRAAYEGAAKITPTEQSIIDKLSEEAQKWDEIKTKRQESAGEIDDTVSQYKELWERLQDITDEQGNVKKGYEEEAETISTTLKEALGIEVEMVDGQIKNYEELGKVIDDTIEKKKGEMYLEAYREDWIEARKGQKEAEDALKASTDLYNDSLKEREEGEAELAKLMEQKNKLDQDGMKGTYEYQNAYDALDRKIKEAEGKIDGANEALGRHRKEIEAAEANVREYQSTIENYNDVMTATAQGGAEDISEATMKMANSFKDSRNATKQELVQQTNEWLKEFEKQNELVEKYGDKEAEKARDAARMMVKWSIEELADLDDEMADEFDKAVRLVKGYAQEFKTVGKMAAQGIADGFTMSSSAVRMAAANTIKDAIDAAKKKALIASPSKLFRDEIGLMLGRGLAEGMEDAEGLVKTASEGLIDAATYDGGYDTEYEIAQSPEDAGLGSVVINVYGAVGQDVSTLADEIAMRFQRMYRKGANVYA